MSKELSFFIKNVLAQTNIVDVVQARMTLKKAGSNYQGICPFHNENTPSFSVNANKQFFYCFGCHASGDALNFIMRNDNLPFIDALELLAKPLGLSLPEKNPDQPRVDKKLFEYLREMTLHCRSDLDQSTQKYLHERGIREETIRKFHIGYCGKNYLSWFDRCKQHKADALIAGGVATRNDKQVKPKFFKRLMFPIQDSIGKVIGFGGRTLDNVPPKYLNSPETEIFKKRHVLYGLYQFRQLKQHDVMVVEGYMDCLALHSNGIPGVVACLGTAFTIQHWQLIKKYVSKITFCFDGDRAGKQAAWKSLISIFPGIDPSIEVRFLFLPDGHDPDSYVKAHGKAGIINAADQAIQWVDFFINTLKNMHPPVNVAGKAAFLQEANAHIATIKNEALQKILKEEINQLLALEPSIEATKIATKKPEANTEKTDEWIHRIIAQLCQKDQQPLPQLSEIDNHKHDPRIDLINAWINTLNQEPEREGKQLLAELQGKTLYESCVQIIKSQQANFNPIQLQSDLINLQIEMIEKLVQETMHNRASGLTNDEQSMLRSLIIQKKHLQQKRHTLMSHSLNEK